MNAVRVSNKFVGTRGSCDEPSTFNTFVSTGKGEGGGTKQTARKVVQGSSILLGFPWSDDGSTMIGYAISFTLTH